MQELAEKLLILALVVEPPQNMTEEQHYESFGRQESKMDPSLGRNKSNRPWKLGVNARYNTIIT
jgi:hypothetical protein